MMYFAVVENVKHKRHHEDGIKQIGEDSIVPNWVARSMDGEPMRYGRRVGIDKRPHKKSAPLDAGR